METFAQKNWDEFQQTLRQLDHTRGKSFSLGVEIGFGTYQNPKNQVHYHTTMRDSMRKHEHYTRILAGQEYGELIAEQTHALFPDFFAEAQNLFVQ